MLYKLCVLCAFAVNMFFLASPAFAFIDKADGNLKFVQTDFSIPNGDLPLELNRFYNLKEMGGGWYFSTHPELVYRAESSIQFMETGIALSGRVSGYRRVERTVSRDNLPTGISFLKWRFNGKEYMFYDVKLNKEVTSASDSDYTVTKQALPDVKKRRDTVGAPGLNPKKPVKFRYMIKHKLSGMKYLYKETENGLVPTEYISANGNKLIFISDNNGRILKIKDVNNRIVSFDYDSKGRVTGVTYPPNRRIQYSYNADGMLTGVINAMGMSMSYAYDKIYPAKTTEKGNGLSLNTPPTAAYGKARLSARTDWNGNVEKYEYDADDRVVRYVNARGNATIYRYIPIEVGVSTTTVTNVRGDTTQYMYTKFQKETRLTKIIDPLGSVEELIWDAARYEAKDTPADSSGATAPTPKVCPPDCGPAKFRKNFKANLNVHIDRNGNRSEQKYDIENNLIRSINALGQVTELSYQNPSSHLVTSITKKGRPGVGGANLTQPQTTRFLYLEQQKLLKEIIDPLGNSRKIDYDPFGKIKSVTDAKGNTTRFEYDKWGNTSGIIDAMGNIITMAYDEAGRLLLIKNALGYRTRFTWDALDRLKTVKNDSGHTIVNTFDDNGNVIQSTDAQNRTTSFVYDQLNRQTEVIDPMGNSTLFSYEDAGCKCSSSVDVGLLTSITDAAGHKTSYQYDALKRLVKEIDNIGQETVYTYDNVGNVLTKTDPNGVTVNYEYNSIYQLLKVVYPDNQLDNTFDGLGRIAQQKDRFSNKKFTYNLLNQIVKVEDLILGKNISYTYDENGNRKSLSTADVGNILYSYDVLNRIVEIVAPGPDITAYTYDSLSRRTGVTHGNGTETIYEYDNLSQLTKLLNQKSDGTAFSFYQYAYNRSGNRTTMTTLNGPTHYTYDNLNRLKQTQYATGDVETFTYDKVGNRLTRDLNGTVTNYAYDTLNRLLTAGNFSYGYDKNGNTVSKTENGAVTGYEFTNSNMLKRVVFPDSTTNIFEYAADGSRVKTVNKAGASTSYFYDGEDIISEFDANNAGIRSYIHGPGIDEPISVSTGPQTHTYHQDGLGSVTGLTDGSGSVAQEYGYDAFGNMTSQAGTVNQPYTYTGREWDSESGLYYYRARYYNSQAGRFMKADPIGFAGGDINLYGYVGGNPVNFVDPSGEFIQVFIGAGIGAGLSLVTALTEKGWGWHLLKSAAIGAAAGAAFTVNPFLVGAAAGVANQVFIKDRSLCDLDLVELGVDVATAGISAKVGSIWLKRQLRMGLEPFNRMVSSVRRAGGNISYSANVQYGTGLMEFGRAVQATMSSILIKTGFQLVLVEYR